MSKRDSLVLLFIGMLFFVIDVNAGPGPPMGGGPMGGGPMGGGGPNCWPNCPIPIDGGLSFLIAAGVGLAGKKFYDYRKKSTD